ncbi:MAG: hypothetical protein ABIN01_05360 [Ferruginibacter sp.]
MATADFTTTILVGQTPEQVFSAINNVRGWWSEEIEGGTEKLNDEFNYHYKDVHISKMKLIEVIPNKKVVWLVMDNHFNFIKDKQEWIGNKVVFEITVMGDKTQLRFTQLGLVAAYECYDICRDAWTNYITNSLRSLITTGKGQPNAKEHDFNEQLLQEHQKLKNIKGQDYHSIITVDATAHKAFESINNVSGWWTENLAGSSQNLGDEFSVRFGEVHYSKQKLVEIVPDKKVVWLVTDSQLNFIEDKQEWTNTKISFAIFQLNNKTKIHFTHIGLVPEVECFDACSNAWSQYIQGSLLSLITTGKGQPEMKEIIQEIKAATLMNE